MLGMLDLLTRFLGGLSIAAHVVGLLLSCPSFVFAESGEFAGPTCVRTSCESTSETLDCVRPGATCDPGAPCKCCPSTRGCKCLP
jgi:hypothetical protein